jgi:hypothetical protein
MEDRIDWLAVGESVSDEAIVSRGRRGMQPQIRDWGCGDECEKEEGRGLPGYAHSVVTLNFASAATCLNLEMPGIEGNGGKGSSGRKRYE